MLKKHIFSGLLVILVGVTPLAVSMPAYAATNTVHQNFWGSLVQFITQRFHLDQNQVKSAVTDFQNQHKAQVMQNMQNREKTRLDKLVTEGKITSSQEQAILDELAKLKQEYSQQNMQNLTPQERKTQFQKEQQELADWAKSQDIDPTLILPGGGMGMKGKIMMHRGWFGEPTTTPTQ